MSFSNFLISRLGIYSTCLVWRYS